MHASLRDKRATYTNHATVMDLFHTVSADELEQLKSTRIVPSHGPKGGGELIAGYRTYLTTLQTRVADEKSRGKTLDQKLQATYPDRNRLTGAIRAAYQEAP